MRALRAAKRLSQLDHSLPHNFTADGNLPRLQGQAQALKGPIAELMLRWLAGEEKGMVGKAILADLGFSSGPHKALKGLIRPLSAS